MENIPGTFKFPQLSAALLRFFGSLRWRISLLLVGVLCLLSLLISVITSESVRVQILYDSGQALTLLAQQFSQQLDSSIFDRWRELHIMASLDTFQNPDASLASKRSLLETMQATYPYYSWVGLTDSEGIVRASTGQLLEGESVAQRPWFIEGSRQVYIGDVHDAVLLANLLPPSPKGEPLRFMDIAEPIFSDTGVLEGVLGAHINWEWAEDLMGNTLAATDAGIALQILSRDGNILLRSSNDEAVSTTVSATSGDGENGYATEIWSDGRTYLTGFAYATGYETYPGLGWVIHASQPLDAALEPANRLQQQIGLITGLLAISFSLAGLFIINTVTSPLRAIVTTARGMRANDTPSAYNQADEIAGLAATLSRLFTDLNERDQELADLSDTFETRVTERTHTAERRARQLSEQMLIQQKVEDALKDSLDTLQRVMEVTQEGIAISVEGEIMYANIAIRNMFGYSGNDMLGVNESQLITPEKRDDYAASLDSSFFETDGVYIDGSAFPIEIFKRPIRYYGNAARVMFIRDITQRKMAEAETKRLNEVTSEQLVELQEVYDELSFEAAHDHLTGLVNRQHFEERLVEAIAAARETSVSVLYIDLDRFKLVNDTLGHAAGDELLRQVAQRLSGCVREGDTLSRLGGDEFALVMPELTTSDEAMQCARHMINVLQLPFQIGENSVVVTSSIGVGFYPADAQTIHQLMHKTDAALYQAKQSGRNNYALASGIAEDDLLLRARLESAMRSAIERGEFRLEYQPQYDLRARRITGFEALLRWHHPELGEVSPAEFIPIAEETGMIIEIGAWALAQASRAVQRWQQASPGVTVAVNVSILQAEQPSFAAQVMQTFSAEQVSLALVELEITESMLMHQNNIFLIQELSSAGIHFAIDDFGTGYSSLMYLQRLPVKTLKIDRTFIQEIGSEKSSSIISAIIMLAHSLNMRIIAEGVETNAQLATLSTLHCDVIQGYLISKSLPDADVLPFLEAFVTPVLP